MVNLLIHSLDRVPSDAARVPFHLSFVDHFVWARSEMKRGSSAQEFKVQGSTDVHEIQKNETIEVIKEDG